jgi:hypothetical protein
VPIAVDAFLVSDRFIHRLTEGDADIFNSMVSIYLQIAIGFNRHVDQPMSCHLVQHMLKKW